MEGDGGNMNFLQLGKTQGWFSFNKLLTVCLGWGWGGGGGGVGEGSMLVVGSEIN
jgi:hypothetical protein